MVFLSGSILYLNNNRAIVFVHYDKDDIIDEYVYKYLNELQKISSYLLFLSTSKLQDKDIKKLSTYCHDVIIRENVGYDFMSYKIGLEHFNYKEFDEIVICNDSVYGPFYSLKQLFEKMSRSQCDFWGITDNTDISYHLQSYFLVFKKNVIQSKVFKEFWDSVAILDSKDDIIRKYEIGLTKILLASGFSSDIYTKFQPTNRQIVFTFLKKLTPMKIWNKLQDIVREKNQIKRVGKINNTHYFWKELLVCEKSPFIKIELLRDNPMKIDINNWEEVIYSISDYDTMLIRKHLTRMKSK